MDRLEEFVRNNRKELDRHSPSPEIWKGIRKGLHRRGPKVKWFSAAAMILVIFTTAALFYVNRRDSKTAQLRRDSNLLIMRVNPQLMETEIYYSNLVNTLFTEAAPMLSIYPDIEKELISDLSRIDSICSDIKKDLRDNVANQEVIEALITNYRTKMVILEEMLEVLRQDENNKVNTDRHEL